MTILEKVGKHPYNCWSPSLGWLCPPFVWWVTIIWMVEYSHFNGGWPSYGSWVTIFLKLGDCPQEGGWPNFGSWVTIFGKAVLESILGIVGEQPLQLSYSRAEKSTEGFCERSWDIRSIAAHIFPILRSYLSLYFGLSKFRLCNNYSHIFPMLSGFITIFSIFSTFLFGLACSWVWSASALSLLASFSTLSQSLHFVSKE